MLPMEFFVYPGLILLMIFNLIIIVCYGVSKATERLEGKKKRIGEINAQRARLIDIAREYGAIDYQTSVNLKRKYGISKIDEEIDD